ncbi:MAG TPA: hypothetical protein VMJ64_17570 [Anaerolineales bacterium]|nr:hypothetical protein [Anaerolineales bacterium]
MKTNRYIILGTAFVLILTAGCGATPASQALVLPDRPEVVAQPAVDKAPAPEAQFPIGHFRSMSGPTDLVLAFHDKHHYQVFMDNALLDTGTLSVSGIQVSIESTKCMAEGAKAAIYTWQYEESDLTFQVVGVDSCAQRREYLTGDFEPVFLFINLLPAPDRSGRTA